MQSELQAPGAYIYYNMGGEVCQPNRQKKFPYKSMT